MQRILMCALIATQVALAGGAAMDAQEAAASNKPTVIDGRKNPELIPDDIALTNLLSSLADGPSAWSWTKRVEYLSPSGLSREEIGQVLFAANTFGAKEFQVSNRLNQIREENPHWGRSAQAKAEVDALLESQKSEGSRLGAELLRTLGASSSAKLMDFVRTKHKSTMTLYRPGDEK